MDYEQDFIDTIRETITAMQARGKPVTEETIDGETHVGWPVDTEYGQSKDGSYEPGKYHRTDTWSYTTLLRPDGTFIKVGQYYSEDTRGMDDLTRSATEVPLSHFVGDRGKPFSQWKAKMERLPYR